MLLLALLFSSLCCCLYACELQKTWSFMPRIDNDTSVRVIDTFTFINEVDLLILRVFELNNTVDEFVVVQCNISFSRLPVEMVRFENEPLLQPYLHKLKPVYCGADYPLESDDPWIRETYLRRFGLQEATKSTTRIDDLIIFSDIDEIPSLRSVQLLKSHVVTEPVALRMPLFKYNLGCEVQGQESWCGSVAAPASVVRGPNGAALRSLCGGLANQLHCAGWHCSSCFSPKLQRLKLEFFSHHREIPEFLKRLDQIENDVRKCAHGSVQFRCGGDMNRLPDAVSKVAQLHYMQPQMNNRSCRA